MALAVLLAAPEPLTAQPRRIRPDHWRHPDNLAPFVATPELVAEKMLEAAGVKPGEVVYDLGCGDGRILFVAAQKFQARAVGIELSPALVQQASEKARKLGLTERVRVVQGNLFDADLREADVVTLYLMRLSNERLKPKLVHELKPGARVVSHDYEIMGWKADRVETVKLHRRPHTIYVYRMPPTLE
ncbi:MAG: class I SAM-dependent methyltransferase [Bryobacteraceae bacterium]|nr:class I SAM-dependent methyltransferase [Bryobacteraceae bacterium]